MGFEGFADHAQAYICKHVVSLVLFQRLLQRHLRQLVLRLRHLLGSEHPWHALNLAVSVENRGIDEIQVDLRVLIIIALQIKNVELLVILGESEIQYLPVRFQNDLKHLGLRLVVLIEVVCLGAIVIGYVAEIVHEFDEARPEIFYGRSGDQVVGPILGVIAGIIVDHIIGDLFIQ